MFWVCKMCGRAMQAEKRPNYCYFDRMDAIENISDADAEKMGLAAGPAVAGFEDKGLFIEFPGDVRWDPITGQAMVAGGRTLRQFQNAVMVEVRG